MNRLLHDQDSKFIEQFHMFGPFYMEVGDPREVRSPHLSCKRDQIEMRDYMDRLVPHLGGFPHLPGVPHPHVNRPKYMKPFYELGLDRVAVYS